MDQFTLHILAFIEHVCITDTKIFAFLNTKIILLIFPGRAEIYRYVDLAGSDRDLENTDFVPLINFNTVIKKGKSFGG